jgi:hypothetical protein
MREQSAGVVRAAGAVRSRRPAVPLTRLARGRSCDGCAHDRRSAGMEHAVEATVSSPAADDNVKRLRLAVFRRLLACMPTTKSSISLSAVSSETGSPDFATPDLTEIRLTQRPFPKDPGERACYRYLLEQMRTAPDRPPQRKAEYETFCRHRFRVTVDSFDYCWREAIKASGARWDQPGRPSR